MARALTYDDFWKTGMQDAGNVLSLDEFDFASGNTAEEIVDNTMKAWAADSEWESQWIEQQGDDFEGLDPHECFEAWQRGWRSEAIDHIQLAIGDHLVKDEVKFLEIIQQKDGGVGALEVAQDFALERNLKLLALGQKFYAVEKWLIEPDPEHGEFYGPYYDSEPGHLRLRDGVEWEIWNNKLTFRYAWAGQEWESTRDHYRGLAGTVTLSAIQKFAAANAWSTLKNMARGREWKYSVSEMKNHIASTVAGGFLPKEIVANPSKRRNPAPEARDEDKAVAKFKEFHSLDPKELVYDRDFQMPKRVDWLGNSMWITYASMKVIPDNGVKPRKPVDYIHDHDSGVKTYVPHEHGDTAVPDFILEAESLTLLGNCLGFGFTKPNGEKGEAKAQRPLPELYCIPSGKALVVVQSKREVLAIIWGGSLDVEDVGITG